MSLDDFVEALETRLHTEQALERKRRVRRREWTILGIFLALALLAVITFERAVVSGISMEPTFHDGQNLLVWKTIPMSRLKIGDVIVLRHRDGGELIKRIVFIQNAEGSLSHPRIVWTPKGNKPFDRLFADYFARVKRGDLPDPGSEYTIYVMGDNFEMSSDSREFGPISPGQVLGKVIQ